MDTPSQRLAQKIIDRLLHEKLLNVQQGKNLIIKLVEGKLRPEDWRLSLDISASKE